jgi:hypothetical protein
MACHLRRGPPQRMASLNARGWCVPARFAGAVHSLGFTRDAPVPRGRLAQWHAYCEAIADPKHIGFQNGIQNRI